MPVLPPLTTVAYNTVNDVLNIARVRVNDDIKTLLPVSGKVLINNMPFMQRVMNTAWRQTQKFLAEKGFQRLIDETVIFQFPIVASLDPAVQCWLSWSGCSDGANFYQQPALPQGFGHPLKMWERWSNQNSVFYDSPLEKMLDGLRSQVKTSSNRWWEWRNDAIYIPGSLNLEDFRIRHTIYLPDFQDQGTTPWFQQSVPINQVDDGLAWLVCGELAHGDETVQQYCIAEGEKSLIKIFNLDVKADQRVNIRRRPLTGRGFSRSWY